MVSTIIFIIIAASEIEQWRVCWEVPSFGISTETTPCWRLKWDRLLSSYFGSASKRSYSFRKKLLARTCGHLHAFWNWSRRFRLWLRSDVSATWIIRREYWNNDYVFLLVLLSIRLDTLVSCINSNSWTQMEKTKKNVLRKSLKNTRTWL